MKKDIVPTISPEDRARLQALGSERVLEDLKSKYRIPTEDTTHTTPKTFSVIEDLNKRRDKLLAELRQLPRHQELYPKEEIENIIRVDKILKKFITKFEESVTNLPPSSLAYQEFCKHFTDQVLQFLDTLNLWAYKFTTEDAGGPHDDEPIIYTEMDSIYYVTKHFISLRIKRSAIPLGLKFVVSPFFEKIVFGMPYTKLSQQIPEVGMRVTEYRSTAFKNLISSGIVSENFTSPMQIFTQDKKIYFVATDEEPHHGDRVNKILSSH